MKYFFKYKKPLIILGLAIVFLGTIVAGAPFLKSFLKENKLSIITGSLNAIDAISSLLPIEQDAKLEISALNQLVSEITKKDNITRSYLVLLQNNHELRPGGGFLGQYAIIKIKNGEVVSSFFEDANLLDQKITVKVPAPYPFQKMMQIKKWKFRDSNFSPNFSVNAEKAVYFMRLAGRNSSFDGVISVNASSLTDILELTGPINVPGFGIYESKDAVLKLQEKVEKAYIMDPSIDTQNRKYIFKVMTPILIEKLAKIENIGKLADFAHQQMKKRNVMLYFKDQNLQNIVKSVNWSGEISQDWKGDYLMLVDANMGALKTDYFMRREISYEIDFTGGKPIVNLNLTYKNTAPRGDWRTSDYHSYLRIYVPEGSNLLERKMVSYPNIGKEFGKTYFGFIEHTLISGQTNIWIKYELPETISEKDYKLLIQKQSGIGDLPVKVKIKTKNGDYVQEKTLVGDLKFELK